MEKQKRKQTTLTLAEKVRIVEDFEQNGETHEALARKYGIGSSTVTRFIQQKDDLREKLAQYSEQGATNRKTMKAPSFPLLEEVLFVWLLQQREANVAVPSDVLRAKAEGMFGELQRRGYYVELRFAFSDGWMRRFRSRFGLQEKRVAAGKRCDEILSDEEILDSVLFGDVNPVPVECCLEESVDGTFFEQSSGSVGDSAPEPEFSNTSNAKD